MSRYSIYFLIRQNYRTFYIKQHVLQFWRLRLAQQYKR